MRGALVYFALQDECSPSNLPILHQKLTAYHSEPAI